jgi:hypothetical protein
MKSKVMAELALGILTLTFCISCSNAKTAEETSVISSVPLPGIGVSCDPGNSACSSQLQMAGSYKVYILFAPGTTCTQTQTQSAIAVKGSVPVSYTNAGLSTFGEQAKWANGATTLSHGSYSMWSWVDVNNNLQLDIQEPYDCQNLTVNGASIGTQTFSDYKSASNSQPALKF